MSGVGTILYFSSHAAATAATAHCVFGDSRPAGERVPRMTSLEDYDYDLPTELIAQDPIAHRADSRLMVIDRSQQSIEHYHFRDLPSFLHEGDLLVLNNTRVIPAKLLGYRETTGGRWQGLFLEKDENDAWKILCKARGKLWEGERIGLVDRAGRNAGWLTLVIKLDDGMWVAKHESEEPTFDLLERIGRVPLPNYIRKGESVVHDYENYQTVFAEHAGSVAAPTAGLHFTETLLGALTAKGVNIAKVTLHVGIGTFRPIKTDNLEEHTMHEEWCEVTAPVCQQIQSTKRAGCRVVAVGTTSVRTLETAALQKPLTAWSGPTDLFIRPPFEFQAVDAMVTNFHLPKSTLLVLVQTFAGRDLIRRAYEAAVQEEYRFFSYGDAMVIV